MKSKKILSTLLAGSVFATSTCMSTCAMGIYAGDSRLLKVSSLPPNAAWAACADVMCDLYYDKLADILIDKGVYTRDNKPTWPLGKCVDLALARVGGNAKAIPQSTGGDVCKLVANAMNEYSVGLDVPRLPKLEFKTATTGDLKYAPYLACTAELHARAMRNEKRCALLTTYRNGPNDYSWSPKKPGDEPIMLVVVDYTYTYKGPAVTVFDPGKPGYSSLSVVNLETLLTKIRRMDWIEITQKR